MLRSTFLMTKIIFLTLLIAGIFTAASLATNEAYAAVDMFLQIDGIEGEAVDTTAGGHSGEIDVLAWSWGMSQSGDGGGAGKVNIQDLTITKFVDKSSTDFWEFLEEGEGCSTCDGFGEVVLTVRKAGDSSLVDYLVITLKNVRVTSVSTGGSSADDRITETIILNFAEIEIQYTPQDPTGDPEEPKTWNHKKPGHR